MLLATVLIGLLSAMAIPMLVRSLDDRAAKATADDYSIFNSAVSAHFLANRAAYVAAMTDGTGADTLCKVGVNPATGAGGLQANNPALHTCAIDGSMLKYLQALPTMVRDANRYGEQWVAIFKLSYTTVAPIAPTGGVEMLVVSAAVTTGGDSVPPDARRYSEANTAAGFTGGNGGVIPDADRSTCVVNKTASIYQACGNGWKVNLSDFISPAQLGAFSNRIQ